MVKDLGNLGRVPQAPKQKLRADRWFIFQSHMLHVWYTYRNMGWKNKTSDATILPVVPHKAVAEVSKIGNL